MTAVVHGSSFVGPISLGYSPVGVPKWRHPSLRLARCPPGVTTYRDQRDAVGVWENEDESSGAEKEPKFAVALFSCVTRVRVDVTRR